MVTIIKEGANKEEIQRALAAIRGSNGFDAYKHCGVIKLIEDPLKIQKELRDEWN